MHYFPYGAPQQRGEAPGAVFRKVSTEPDYACTSCRVVHYCNSTGLYVSGFFMNTYGHVREIPMVMLTVSVAPSISQSFTMSWVLRESPGFRNLNRISLSGP